MFIKFFFSALLALTLAVTPIFAQSPPSPPVPPAAAPNSTTGLELPPDQKVNYDEGFVKIEAKTKGTVKWLIVSNQKVKFVTVPPNSVIISVPPASGQVISVFAVGLVDNQLTDFVRTNVTISGGPAPPGPNPPGPNPPGPVVGRLHFTFLVDLNNATPEQAQLLNSKTLRTAITEKNAFFRIYDKTSPVVAQKKLDIYLQKSGGQSALIIQNDQGQVLSASPIPRTDAEVIAILNKLTER